MSFFAYYLLKVFLCSGILYLYYLAALKNKAFHQWNRFYLLSAVGLSLLLPLVKFTVFDGGAEEQKALQLLYAVQSADDYLEAITVSSAPVRLSSEQWIFIAYGCVSLLSFSLFMVALVRIRRLINAYAVQKVAGIHFLNTREPGTPFSFLRYIFWNEDIPLHSEGGQRIFQHETVHVQEGHTWDKLFLRAVLTVFWCNPFFWIVRRELGFIHEFIADQKAVNENGADAFAAMILQAAYPRQFHAIVNPFFQTSIKRRLLMLTKIQNPRLNYTSRIVALPLIALVAFAFTVRTKEIAKSVKLDKEFVVVIDAGHGKKDGHFTGAREGAVYEDELTLALAKKIKAANTNPNLKIVFTRNDDDIVELKDRVAIAQNARADLFLSLHLNAVPGAVTAKGESLQKDKIEGIQIYVPADNLPVESQSRLLGSSLITQMASLYKTNPTLLKSRVSIYVLNAAPCPAALIEFGTINNQTDKDFVTSPANQEKLAQHILEAVQQYAASKEKGIGIVTDTIPKAKKEIASVDVNSARKMLTVYYTDGTCETMTEKEASDRGMVHNGGYGNVQKPAPQDVEAKAEIRVKDSKLKPLIIIDGNEVAYDLLNAIDPNKIQSINVLKGPVNKYGTKGENGVIEIKTKTVKGGKINLTADNLTGTIDSLEIYSTQPLSLRANFAVDNPVPDDSTKKGLKEVIVVGYPARKEPVFEQTETPASVDKNEWQKFLEMHLLKVVNEVGKTAPAGTYTVNVRFVVNKDGSLSDFKALDDPGYGIGEKVLNVMQYSPKWTPAEQNGKIVKSYHTQPVRLVVSKR